MQKEVLTGVVTAVATTFVLWGLGQTFGLLRDVSFSVEVPPGAVVAFDREAGCPGGWSNVGRDESQRFAGRTFIVAGPRVDRETSDQTTLSRAFDDRGGTEEHTLIEAQVPSHSHGGSGLSEIYIADNFSTGADGPQMGSQWGFHVLHRGGPYGTSSPALMTDWGGGEPHNNMPPYIALHFCKKEAR